MFIDAAPLLLVDDRYEVGRDQVRRDGVGRDGVGAGGFADFPEAVDLLGELLGALGACDGVAALHFDSGDEPVVLHRAGRAATDPALTDAAMRHAARSLDDGADLGDLEPESLGPAHRNVEALTVAFPCREVRTRLTITVLAAADPTADLSAARRLRRAVLKRTAALLAPAFRLWQRLRSQSQERRGLAVALDAVEFGIILVDREGQVGHANAAARAMLAEGRFLRKRGGALCAHQLRDTMKLQGALAAAISANVGEGGDEDGNGSDASSEAGLLQLTAGDARLVAAAIPAEQPAREPGAVAAMLVLHDPDRRYERLVAPVCKLFGLSSVETRLAIHLVAGNSLAEASRLMRVKEQTARGYLKQVFLKANVKRQSDLVRLLLSSLLSTRLRCAPRAA